MGGAAAGGLDADASATVSGLSEDAGNKACGAKRSPYISACGYDTAGELLQHLLGPLAPPAAQSTGRLESFDQGPFGGRSISMDDEGYTCTSRRTAKRGAAASSRLSRLPAGQGCFRGKGSVRLLGLVGLSRRAIPHEGRRADPRS